MSMERRGLWTDLIADNPAIKDSHRLPWLRMNPKTWSTNTIVSVCILVVTYIGLLTLALQGAQFLDATLFMYVCLTCCGFAPAVVLYGSIAGEREKRTIDLLLVAPVTTAQIITSKLLKIILPVISVIVLLVIPIVVFAFVRPRLGLTPIESGAPLVPAIFGTILICVTVSLFVTGLSMWVSGLNRTTAGALTGVLALLFVVYIVYPVTAGVFSVVNKNFSDWMMVVHPFAAVNSLTATGQDRINPLVSVAVTSFCHAAFGILFLVLSVRQLDRFRAKQESIHA